MVSEHINNVWKDFTETNEQRYSIDYVGERKTYTFPSDVSEIIWFDESSNNCNYCGYGDDIKIISKMKDGNFTFFKSWTGCMSYDEDSFLYVANTLYSIYHYCMDDQDRKVFDSE